MKDVRNGMYVIVMGMVALGVLMGSINARKVSNIEARGRELIEAAKTLPDAKRIEFTNQTAQLLQTIAADP